MIQFFVNNQEIILPADFSFTMIENNPEINNEGVFTLDMTVSLRPPKNAIAFKFIHRLNNAGIEKTADALLVDNGVFRYGMIRIVDNTNISVSFQYLAGNSELNYIAKNEKKIWELDWGTESAIDFARAFDSISNPIYLKNFVCAPVKISNSEGPIIYNNYKFIENVNIENRNETVTSVEHILMQPYLLYYINKLPTLLGYTLVSNVLNSDERAKTMYLVNSIDSLNYADCLPDITITEFIDSIESFFNVSFVVNSTNKTISIISYKNNYLNKKIVHVTNVLDSYSRKLIDSEVINRLKFSKIKYDLRDSIYFKYQELEDDILKILTQVDFDTYDDIWAFIQANSLQNIENPLYLFNVLDEDNSYFYGNATISLYRKNLSNYKGNLINKFKAWGDGDNILTLSIVPAEMETAQLRLHFLNLNDNDVYLAYQYPKSSNNYYVQYNQNLVEMVENTIKKIPRITNLEVALFTGIIPMNNAWFFQDDYSFEYPFSHLDYKPEFGQMIGASEIYTKFEIWTNEVFSPNVVKSMRLCGLNGIVSDYHQESILDNSEEYTFTFPDGPDVSANNIFMINNLKYMPISLERIKSNKKKTVKGTFYRML